MGESEGKAFKLHTPPDVLTRDVTRMFSSGGHYFYIYCCLSLQNSNDTYFHVLLVQTYFSNNKLKK